ncbi:MAG: hypothetical protein JWL81_1682, partial [Verrucomicrobiales bacterium]|nr:hypothetical protein [Verrucomicrobiales bacterium]
MKPHFPNFRQRPRAVLTGVTALACLLFPSWLHAHGGSSHPNLLGVDQNHNQLSDLFEKLYPGLTGPDDDADQDGQSNRQENAAATDPLNPASRLDFSQVNMEIAGISTDWATQAGKEYQIQTAESLAGPWVNEGPATVGDGTPLQCLCPRTGPVQFLRLQVRDIDSDADGVTDWEERKAGTDPLLADTDGDGRRDLERIVAQLSLQNRINVAATTAKATEAGANAAVFHFIRTGNLDPVTVNYALGGTATPGVDFTPLSGIVFLPMGATTATVTVTPIADGQAEPTETLILSVAPGSNYTAGGIASATATFDDSRAGLIGRYFNTQESTYPAFPATNANFDPAQLKLTRVDGPIDFNWGAGPPAGTGLTEPDDWSIRWLGQLVPPVTGNYTFHLVADRGGVLAINGTTRINQWATTAATEHNSPTIALTAGVPVDLRLDHRESGTTPAESVIRLSWTPPGGTKALIPFSAFICDPTVPATSGRPVLTSPTYAFALRNAPFS